MSHIDAVVQQLASGAYRYTDDRWEYEWSLDVWHASTVLDGYDYEEGVAVIAACPWATLVEREPTEEELHADFDRRTDA